MLQPVVVGVLHIIPLLPTVILPPIVLVAALVNHKVKQVLQPPMVLGHNGAHIILGTAPVVLVAVRLAAPVRHPLALRVVEVLPPNRRHRPPWVPMVPGGFGVVGVLRVAWLAVPDPVNPTVGVWVWVAPLD